MSALRIGELCAGYNGLGMAVEEVFTAETAWFSEFDSAPSKILAHHYPDVPNHGDMTVIDWSAIEQVDIISGGTPCQDVSAAGKRRGMTEGTRSNLFIKMCEAIEVQQPDWVVWENVRGAYSACADSEMGQCPGCVDRRKPHRPFLRALGRVLGNLHDLGYDCQWRGLRVADVGGCHPRFRVFVRRFRRTAKDTDISTGREWGVTAPGQTTGGRSWSDAGGRDRTPTADTSSARRTEGQDGGTGSGHESQGPWSGEPQRDGGERTGSTADAYSRDDAWWIEDAQRIEEWRESTAGISRGLRVAADAGSAAVRELPGRALEEEAGPASSDGSSDHHGERATTNWGQTTPNTADDDGDGRSNPGTGSRGAGANWGPYEPAIRRHERIFGRPAPRPTEPTGRNHGERLSPRFTEWMMGLPDGWVTDPAIGITRNEQLKACGNGVVPQQAIAALRNMLTAFESLGVRA